MRIVLKNLGRRRTRTFFAILGIAVGIAAVVGLISLARGFSQGVEDMLVRLRGDLICKQRDRVTPQSSRIPEARVAEIGALKGVAGVSGYTIQLLYFGDLRVPIYGFHPAQPILQKVDVVEGRRLAVGGLREVMIGSEVAVSLGLHAGDTLTVPPNDPNGQELEVVGIYTTGARYQDFGCIVHLHAAQLVGKMPEQVMLLAVDAAAPDSVLELRDALRVRYPELEIRRSRGYLENLDDFQLVTNFAWAVSTIAAIVGAIGVINTMLMSVAERTREIGMLLALGWSRGMVLRMILAEGVAVSVIGGVLGFGLGVVLVQVVSNVLRDLPIVPGHDLRLFGEAMAMALSLGALGSLLPAYKASRLSPVEALRYE